MTDIEKCIYLELLRAALWGRKVNMAVFQGEWNWKAILNAYSKHDTLGLVANKIILLPEEFKPSIQEMAYVYNYLGSLVQSHRQLNKRLADMMPKLEEVGCYPILLKGQGLSVLYPNGCVRACGDLDIFVGEDKFENAKKLVNSMATIEELEEAVSISHHYQISIANITYELHRKLGVAGNRSYKAAFLSVADQYISSKECEKVALSISSSENTFIRVPSLELNVWYVFNHLMEHFTDSGVNIRQFCDWMMVILEYNKKYGKTKEKELKEVLHKIGLLRAWKIMGGILTNQLGLQPDEFPLYDERMAKMSQCFIVDEMLDGSRFRFASFDKIDEQGKGLKHILTTMRYYYYCSRHLFVLSPFMPYLNCGKNIANGIKHSFGKHKNRLLF